MGASPARPVVVDLADGDQLLNTAAICELLGIKVSTFQSYEARRTQYLNPLPQPEEDPLGLVVSDPAEAANVRRLFQVVAGARHVPKMWRRSAILAWEAQRARGSRALR